MIAINEVLPEAKHRMCPMHILVAWRKNGGERRGGKFFGNVHTPHLRPNSKTNCMR